MGRNTRNNQQSTSTLKNPSTKFLTWKSKEKTFSYWDGDKQEEVSLELPLKAIFLEHYHTVKGYSEAHGTRMYSNEVVRVDDKITLRTFKNEAKGKPSVVVYEGPYKGKKADIESKGGKYHRSVYVMLEDGSIANLSFQGSGAGAWTEFFTTNKRLLDNKWFEVKGSIDKKKGTVKFSIPDIVLSDAISAEDAVKADAVDKILEDYMIEYLNNGTTETKELEVVEAEEVSDELDF